MEKIGYIQTYGHDAGETVGWPKDSQWEFAVLTRTQPGFTNSRGVGWGGRWEEGDICVPVTDSC